MFNLYLLPLALAIEGYCAIIGLRREKREEKDNDQKTKRKALLYDNPADQAVVCIDAYRTFIRKCLYTKG